MLFEILLLDGVLEDCIFFVGKDFVRGFFFPIFQFQILFLDGVWEDFAFFVGKDFVRGFFLPNFSVPNCVPRWCSIGFCLFCRKEFSSWEFHQIWGFLAKFEFKVLFVLQKIFFTFQTFSVPFSIGRFLSLALGIFLPKKFFLITLTNFLPKNLCFCLCTFLPK